MKILSTMMCCGVSYVEYVRSMVGTVGGLGDDGDRQAVGLHPSQTANIHKILNSLLLDGGDARIDSEQEPRHGGRR